MMNEQNQNMIIVTKTNTHKKMKQAIKPKKTKLQHWHQLKIHTMKMNKLKESGKI